MTKRARAVFWLATALLMGGAAHDHARAESDWLQNAFPEKAVEQQVRRAKRPLTRSQAPRARAEARVRVPLRNKQDQERNAIATMRQDAEHAEAKPQGAARSAAGESRATPYATDEAAIRMGTSVPVSSAPATSARDANAPSTTASVTSHSDVRPAAPPVFSQKVEEAKTLPSHVSPGTADGKGTVQPGATATTAQPVAGSGSISSAIAADAGKAAAKATDVAALVPPALPPAVAPMENAPKETPAQITRPSPAPPSIHLPAVAPSPPPRPLQSPDGKGNAVAATASDARAAAVERGKQLWQVRRGPRGAALEECDLGLGKGRVVGTFAHLPRYFADVSRVMDLEARILWCAQTLQSTVMRDLTRPRPVDGGAVSELDDLAAYVASLSISWRLSPPFQHAKEKQAVDVGAALYARRQGPFDFACATCHGSGGEATGPAPAAAGTRRAMTDWNGIGIPRLDKPEEARTVLAAIPFRGTAVNETRTMQARIARCFGYAGVEAPEVGSDALVALVSYLAKLGEHGEITATRRKP